MYMYINTTMYINITTYMHTLDSVPVVGFVVVDAGSDSVPVVGLVVVDACEIFLPSGVRTAFVSSSGSEVDILMTSSTGISALIVAAAIIES